MQTHYDDKNVPSGSGLRFAIVVSEWHKEHLLHMVEEARTIFAKHGVSEPHVELFWAPGSFEIPVICRALCRSGKSLLSWRSASSFAVTRATLT